MTDLNSPVVIDAEIARITGAYSEDDREALSPGLQKVVQSSDIVKLLDVRNAVGSGTLRSVLDVCTRLGKVDASLAWVVGVSNSAWTMRNCFQSLESADDIFERNKLLAMVLGRPGTLEKDLASDRWVLNGEWRYASGWKYASYFFCLASVVGSNGKDIRAVAVPAEQMELVRDWHSTGLRATQSVTICAENVSLSDSHLVDYTAILTGTHTHDVSHLGINYSGLFTGVLMNCLTGSMLGAVEAGYDYVLNKAPNYPVLGSTYSAMSESGAIRTELGRLGSQLDMYKRAAEYNADIVDQAARKTDASLSTEDRVHIRGRATQVMRGCVNVIQDLLWVHGASGLDKSSPLERIWRDINVGARHGGFSKLIPEETVGITALNRDPRSLTYMF